MSGKADGRKRSARRDDGGSNIVTPSRAAVRRAVDALSPDLAWDELRDGLRPVFLRRRPMPPGAERPVTFKLPLGISVGLGVDIGPAFLYVGSEMLASWAVTADEAFATAMDNLRGAVAAERYIEMEYGTIAEIPLWFYQSHGGLASGILLIEDELVRRYGDEPRLLVAPMRNLLVAAPFDADRETIGWIRDEISLEDPNGLDLPIFALVEGKLWIDAGSSASAENGALARVH
jgi:hypothetical protein